jgi:hypothetical protein
MMPGWWDYSSIRGGSDGRRISSTEPRQLRAYLPGVAIRPPSLPASFPVARRGCALRRFSGAVCVLEHLREWQTVAASPWATFSTCPALSSGASLGSRPPFCSRPPFGSCPTLHWCPFFPGRARGRRTFLRFAICPLLSRLTLSFPRKEGTPRRAQPKDKTHADATHFHYPCGQKRRHHLRTELPPHPDFCQDNASPTGLPNGITSVVRSDPPGDGMP